MKFPCFVEVSSREPGDREPVKRTWYCDGSGHNLDAAGVARALEARDALRMRVAELEDHARRYRALAWIDTKQETLAIQMLRGIRARRGEEWAGAEVSNEPEEP